MALHNRLGFPIISKWQEARKFEQPSEISSKIEDIQWLQLEEIRLEQVLCHFWEVWAKSFTSVVSLGSELPAHLSYGRGCYVPSEFLVAGSKTDL